MEESYKEDLAFIHDVGFSDYALKSAPNILKIFHEYKIQTGLSLVVDLGCGSGLWAEELSSANYQVFGIDISHAMIKIARQRVPDAEFLVGSLFQAEIPSCNAVTSIGECLNYLFDVENNHQTILKLFHRIYSALKPGGVFIFDIAEPGQVTPGISHQAFTEGEDWTVLVEKEENREQQTLIRRIISFRKVGEYFRRNEEIHRLRLYKATDIAEHLHQVGFQVQTTSNYGDYQLPKAHVAFIALKPIGVKNQQLF